MSKPLPKIQPDEHGMRMLGNILKEVLPSKYGFTLLIFPYEDTDHMANYISSAHRDDMLKFLEETLNRLKGGKDIATPNMN